MHEYSLAFHASKVQAEGTSLCIMGNVSVSVLLMSTALILEELPSPAPIPALAGEREKQGLMPPADEPFYQPHQEQHPDDHRVCHIVAPRPVRLHLVQADVHICDGQADDGPADEPMVLLEEPPACNATTQSGRVCNALFCNPDQVSKECSWVPASTHNRPRTPISPANTPQF